MRQRTEPESKGRAPLHAGNSAYAPSTQASSRNPSSRQQITTLTSASSNAPQYRNPSLSTVPSVQAAAAAKLQKSSVFQRLVQNQKKKYDRRAEEDEQEREQEKLKEKERIKGRPITH